MNIKEKIFYNLQIQKSFFNPKKCPGKNMDFQFVFHEEDEKIEYYLQVKNKECEIVKGRSKNITCEIITKIDTWEKIGGGYTTGMKEIKSGNLKIIGLSKFVFIYYKIFSGNDEYTIPENLYINSSKPRPFKNILVLSCSPRKSKGATHFFTERFIAGMEKAGANVEIIFPARLKIKPCIGCFECWAKNKKECIYDKKDDMKIIFEKFFKSDLIVWATPIYIYHCSSIMKIVMDRLFIFSDPHFYKFKNKESHPKKFDHFVSNMLLTVSGFDDKDVFEPILKTFTAIQNHGGSELVGTLFRSSSMSFLINEIKSVKKEKILSAFETCGYELIKNRYINKKTKKIAEQKIYKDKMIYAAANFHMDLMQKKQKVIFHRDISI